MWKYLEIFLVQTLIALIVVLSSASWFHIQLILILEFQFTHLGFIFLSLFLLQWLRVWLGQLFQHGELFLHNAQILLCVKVL